MSNFVHRFAPEISENNDTMKIIYDIQRVEIEKLQGAIKECIDNTFLQTVNLKGIRLWEKIYSLYNNSNVSESARKEILIIKRQFRPPFTMHNIRSVIDQVYGEGNYILEEYPNIYEMIIDIETDDPYSFLKFKQYIRNLIPANMYLIFSVQYTYLYLKKHYTYGQLESLTYGELSQYAYTTRQGEQE